MNKKSPVVAVIDVGSNTIKLLIAKKGDPLVVVEDEICPTRIIHREDNIHKRLSEESIEAGCESINHLVQQALKYSPQRITIVATSAVRDAENQDFFKMRIRESTGYTLQVLSGEEEALTISQGVVQDPELTNVSSFYLVDLGGGSLELIDYANESIHQLASLPTGAVRIADKFVQDKRSKLHQSVAETIKQFIHKEIKTSGFTLENKGQPLVATSGSLAVAKKLIYKQSSKNIHEPPHIPVKVLRKLCTDLSKLNLVQRCNFPGMPISHADILPVALIIFLTIADEVGADKIIHSKFNLRYGLAAQLLSEIIEGS